MISFKRELFNRLGQHGWRRAEDAPEPPDWWADEVWVLESTWPPTECRVYLVFVVDPQWEGPRERGQGVWAVSASLDCPDSRFDVRLTLDRGWRGRLPELFAYLSALRNLVGWVIGCLEQW